MRRRGELLCQGLLCLRPFVVVRGVRGDKGLLAMHELRALRPLPLGNLQAEECPRRLLGRSDAAAEQSGRGQEP